MSYPNFPYYNGYPPGPTAGPSSYPAQHYGTPAYPQAYPNFYPQSGNTPFIPPATPLDNPSAALNPAPQSNPAGAAPKKRHRKTATIPNTGIGLPSMGMPLKSAMKKSKARDPQPNPEPTTLTRERTTSNAQRMSRQRTHSNPQATMVQQQQHLFLSFHGDDEMRIEFCSAPAIEEIKARILRLWPDGVMEDQFKGYEWRVKFRNAPWRSDEKASQAWTLVISLFTLFAARGYVFQTAVSTGNPPPRLIFGATEVLSANFFAVYFSRKNTRVTLYRAPSVVQERLGSLLNMRLDGEIASDKPSDEQVRIIELKVSASGTPRVEPVAFMMHILSALSELGQSLETSVPLGKKRLGVAGARRELLIFRGV